MKDQKGFEQVWLVVFLAIMVLLGFILMPALQKKIQSDREIRLGALMRKFYEANEEYRRRHPRDGYAGSLRDFVHNAEKLPYLEASWLQPEMIGYRLAYETDTQKTPRAAYALKAEWAHPGWRGEPRTVCIDQQGIIRRSDAASGQTPLQTGSRGCSGGIEVV